MSAMVIFNDYECSINDDQSKYSRNKASLICQIIRQILVYINSLSPGIYNDSKLEG